jgi:glycosyltransferase involved in cell wall biosynthesis
MQVVFWQRMFTPHMMGLAEAMAARGHTVHFVAQVSEVVGVACHLIRDLDEARGFIGTLGSDTVHISQGIRGNGIIGNFQKLISRAGHRQWVVMETVEDSGFRGFAKRIIYGLLLRHRRRDIQGVLAIGAGTYAWLVNRGFPPSRVFPFSYFIKPNYPKRKRSLFGETFTFGFVGNLEPWKNPRLALSAYLKLAGDSQRLVFIGDGSEYNFLKRTSEKASPNKKIVFLGRVPMPAVPTLLADLDCLILPSDVDGWGVVASEAMIVGTPVICSSACGVRDAVKSSPLGAVFRSGSEESLLSAMEKMKISLKGGHFKRLELEKWSKCLEANFGASYLEGIISGKPLTGIPTWLQQVKVLQ